MTIPKTTVCINVDSQTFQTPSNLSGAQIKALVEKDIQYQLFMETQQNTDRVINDSDSISLRDGMRFYTVPPAAFGVDERLKAEIDELRATFNADVRRTQDGATVVAIPSFPLPSGWNKTTSQIWFRIPLGYPVAAPDSFWADADLRTLSGGLPMNTILQRPDEDGIEKLWFSWHPSRWDPKGDRLITFVRVIRDRMSRKA